MGTPTRSAPGGSDETQKARARDNGSPSNDEDVDLVLTERHLREFIVQADRGLAKKVMADVAEALDVLRRWT